jgi:hypothetical protein
MKDGSLGHTVVGAVEGREGDLNRVKGIQQRQSNAHFRRMIGLAFGIALVWSVAGCHKTSAQDQNGANYQNAGDPADANMAGGASASGQPQQVMGQRAENEAQQQAQDYQQPAPIERRGPDGTYYSPNANYDPNAGYDANYDDLSDEEAQNIYESDLTDGEANEPPPPIPDYDQPPAPDPDYLWTPGYWAWGAYGYYWVPGCWVEAPFVGALWTPGYWSYYGGAYRFHHGYWGRHVGFYGGINYGFGYFGLGYYGGYWNGPHFYYNRSVNHIDDRRIHYVYNHDERGEHQRFAGGTSFNGGPRGIQVRPRPAEIAVLREDRRAPVPQQIRLRQESGQNRQQFFNQNRGRPAVTVDARPIATDHRMPAELPRHNFPVRNGQQHRGFRQDNGAGQVQQPQVQQTQPEYRRVPNGVQGQQQNRAEPQQPPVQGQPQPQTQQAPFRRGPRDQQAQPQVQQQPQAQPVQPQHRRGQEGVQAQPQPAPQTQPQAQPPTQQAPFRPWSREQRGQPQPAPQAQPQPQPQPQFRHGPQQQAPPPQAAPQAQPQLQPQFRRGPQQQAPPPQAAPQVQPQPQPQFRRGPQQPQAQPQPQAAPAPQPRAQPQPPPQARPQPQQGRPEHQGRGEDRKDERGH